MTAIKVRIKDLIEGTFDGTCVHTPAGEVSEARILGTLIDIFTTDDDSYMSLTVDDGTETIRIKAWRQDIQKLKEFSKGDLIDVVGRIREYNEEIYLTPEVISKVSPNRWILRELELMKLHMTLQPAHIAQEPNKMTEISEIESEKEFELQEPTEEKSKKEREREKGEIQLKGEKESKGVLEEKAHFEEIEEFEILGEDEVVETVLDLLEEGMNKETLIQKSGLDEIDVELSLRELLDEGKIIKEGDIYKKISK
jgi:RPA family protein